MPYVHVEIKMDEIDTDDLVDELLKRLRYGKRKHKEGKVDELKALLQECEMLFDDFTNLTGIVVRSLEDKMKCEHISQVFEKYTISHIQSVLP